MTVGAVDAKVKRDSGRIDKWEAYQRARATHEAWQGLLDAWRQKGFSIKTLADLYAAQYFSLSSTQSSRPQPGRYDHADTSSERARRAPAGEKLTDPTGNLPTTQPTRRRASL